MDISKETDFVKWQTALKRGDMKTLSQSITLIESTRESDQSNIDKMVSWLMQQVGAAYRIAVTGTPGVGKSTFIEVAGLNFINKGHRVAVLSIDPTSQQSHGSILGDKTRMPELIASEHAYIRPSPSSTNSGGVADRTLEVAWLCEVAGFDIILIETVGVGQGEIDVKAMVDYYLVLTQVNSGDDLQGIKKGVMEQADAIVINKADQAVPSELEHTINLWEQSVALRSMNAEVPVFSVSSLQNHDVDVVVDSIKVQLMKRTQSDSLKHLRDSQLVTWFEKRLKKELLSMFEKHLDESSDTSQAITQIRSGRSSTKDVFANYFEKFARSLR